jgi:hypothetical protein
VIARGLSFTHLYSSPIDTGRRVVEDWRGKRIDDTSFAMMRNDEMIRLGEAQEAPEL